MRIATRYLVRPMRLDDIAQVVEIERESFPTMWPPTAFPRELHNRLARYVVVLERHPEYEESGEVLAAPERSGGVGRLLRSVLRGEEEPPLPPPDRRAELIVGFAGAWMLPDEVHLVTVAVRESHRRRGIGEQLLISVIELARAAEEPTVTLEVRVSNEAALNLYDKFAFRQVGLRSRYYSDNHEDAFILTAGSILNPEYEALLEERRAEHRARWGDFETHLE